MARNTVEVLVDIKKTGTGAEEAEKELTGLEKATRVAGAAMATFAVKETAAAVFELGKLGAESLRTRNSFEAISGSADEAAARLDAMKRATRGAISEQDAMAAANKLMQMGLADSAEALEKTTTFAVRLGAAMGKDATQSLEEWSLLMANQSIPRLDTFGVSAAKVRQRMGELKASVADMSREQAFNIAVTEEAEASLARLGDAAEDDMLAFERLEANSADLKAMLGELLAPAVADVTGELAGLAGTMVEQERTMQEYRRVLGDTAVEAVFAEDGYHRQGRALEVLGERYDEVMRMMEHAGTLTDGWIGAVTRTTEALGDEEAALGRAAMSTVEYMRIAGDWTGTLAAYTDYQAEKEAAVREGTEGELAALEEGWAAQLEEQRTHFAEMQAAYLENQLKTGELTDEQRVVTEQALEALSLKFGLTSEDALKMAEAEDVLRDSLQGMTGEDVPNWVEAMGKFQEATVDNKISADELTDMLGDLDDETQNRLLEIFPEAKGVIDRMGVSMGDMETATRDMTTALQQIPTTIDIEIKYHTTGAPPAGMQHGGVWPGGVGWVGEGGPELAVFPRGTRIVPAWESRQMVRSTTDNRTWGAVNTTIIVQDPLAAAMVLEEKRRETTRRLRRGM